MVKKKRPGPSKKGKTSYADERRYKKMLGYEIVSLWTAQLVLDTLAIVLNDPDVMRSHTLGANRLERVTKAFNKLWEDTQKALQKTDEADYWRTKIDQAQAQIFGPDYLHWQERYPYWDERDTY